MQADSIDNPPSLATFIRSDMEGILKEWDAFARSLSSGRTLRAAVLRDHGQELLNAIADDMERPQTTEAQTAKAKGLTPESTEPLSVAGEEHAAARIMVHFSLSELIAEFRALRACVLRRWATQQSTHHPLSEVTRFNESMDEALCASVERFQTKLESSRDVILGVLAHDLRNPLHAAAMSAQFILRNPLLDSNCLKAALLIQRSTKHMNELISDLLDYARTRLGEGLPLKVESCDMAVLCGDAVDEMQACHPGRTISYDLISNARGTWDSTRIKQLLSNLLANAIQHGDPQAPVKVTVTATADAVQIRVHNGGEPVPVARQGSIFKPLYVIRDHRPESLSAGSSGLGLGLYISRQIAIAHGGDIEVSSSQELGTTFTTTLPLHPIGAPAANHAEERPA